MNKTFQIQAQTVCLGEDPSRTEEYLLKAGVIFHIPYLPAVLFLGKTEIDKFIKDLFRPFRTLRLVYDGH